MQKKLRLQKEEKILNDVIKKLTKLAQGIKL